MSFVQEDVTGALGAAARTFNVDLAAPLGELAQLVWHQETLHSLMGSKSPSLIATFSPGSGEQLSRVS